MTDQSISPLHRRMTFPSPAEAGYAKAGRGHSLPRPPEPGIRGFTAATQRGYIAAVKDFTAFLGRSPDQAGAEDLRRS